MSERAERLLIALVLLLAAFLRFWSIDFGFPDWWARPDEANVTTRVMRMLLSGTHSPGFFEYPAGWLYLLRWLFATAARIGIATGTWSDVGAFHAAYVSDPTPWLLAARLTSALCGVATVGVVALLSRRIVGTGSVAAFFLAVAPLHVRDSRFGVTDVPVTLAVACALLWAERLRRRRADGGNDGGDLVVAGLWVGLAGAIKYNAALVGIAPAVALFWSRWRSRESIVAVLVVASVATAVFFAINPFIVLDFDRFASDFAFQSHHISEGHGRDLGIGFRYHFTDTLRFALTAPLLFASLLGVLIAIARPRRHRAFLPPLAFALLYYLAMGTGRTVFFRYMIPILPVLAITAGLAVRVVAERIQSARTGRIVVTSLLALALGAPALAASIRHARIIGRTDTRELAARWLREHVRADEGVVLAGGQGSLYGEPRLPGLEWCQILTLEVEPPVCPDEALFSTLRMVDPRAGLGMIDRESFPWVLTHEHELSLYSALHFKLRAELERGAEPVVVFEPGPRGEERHGVFDPIDAYYAPIAGFGGYERPGPTIRVWRLKG
ncbi:MAG: hypothetical protein CME06_04310 [Gemmatimonadetes bacterium]|nr:hypothetical protein [Gemmatimonadota bacterium]